MAGKAPLLLAMVLFLVGAVGLGLTSAEKASWGPFQPPNPNLAEQRIVIVPIGYEFQDPPSLVELMQPVETAVLSEEPEMVVAAATEVAPPEAAEESTETPVTPLRIFGISADDGGVSAAGTTPTPPPPIRIGGISFDETVEPEPSADPDVAAPEPSTQAESADEPQTAAE